MSRKTKRQKLKMMVEKSIIRDEEKQRIRWSATTSTKEVLIILESSLCGLDEDQIRKNRETYGKNQIIEEPQKSIFQRISNMINRPTCNVVRNNKKPINIPSKDLVVGDIVNLVEGDNVPADVRLIESNKLVVDQGRFTGKNNPVKKNSGICIGNLDKVTDYFNIVLMGSSVLSGSAKGVVLSVGDHTILETMK